MTTRSTPRHNTAKHASALATAFVATLAIGFAANLYAQTSQLVANANGETRATERPQERPTFWLVDQQGWRIPLPNWTIEDVMRAVDSRSETKEAPLYSIQRVSADGEVVGGVARLTIKAFVSVADGVVRVPLGLKEGVYIPEENAPNDALGGFSYEGPGLCAFEVDAHTGEYSVVVNTPRKPIAITRGQEASQSEEQEGQVSEEESDVAQNTTQDPDVDEPTATSTPNPESVESERSDVADAEQNETQDSDVDETTPTLEPERIESERSDAGDARPALINQYEFTLNLSFVVEKTTENKTATFVDVDSDDTEYRLVASFPPSLTSDLRLLATPYDIELTSVKGAAADAPTPYDERFSEIKMRGLGRGGETVEIAWRKERKKRGDDSTLPAAEEAVVLLVENALITAELSESDVSYDVSLPIKVFGGKRNLFQIILPTGATVTPDVVTATDANGAKFEIQETTVKDVEYADKQAKALEVRLREETKAATINLKTHAPNEFELGEDDDSKPSERIISGFAVLGAQKQFGRVKLVQSPDAVFNVAPKTGVSNSSDEILEDGEEVYSFYMQPFQLRAEKIENKPTVNVKPEYLLNVGYDDQTMRVRFLYSVYGAKVKELKAKINGWEFSELVDPKNVFKQYDAGPEENGVWRFPLNAPLKGEIVLEMILKRAQNGENASENENEANAETKRLEIETPTPVADSVEAGALVVAPEDSVEFSSNVDETIGLSTKTARSMSLAVEQAKTPRQTTLYYQTKSIGSGNDDKIKLVAELRRLPQEIEANVKTDASISDKGILRVTETINYKIERESLDSLTFVALDPIAEIVENRAVKCFVDGKPQNIVVEGEIKEEIDRSEDEKDDSDRKTSFSVPLDAPKLGTCVVTFQYELPSVEMLENATNYFVVKLLQPSERVNDVEVKTKNELTLVAPNGYEISYMTKQSSDAFWRPDPYERAEDARAEVMRLRSHMPELYAPFGVALGMEAVSTIVDRAWVQSWITDSMRVDRAAYRVSCKRSILEIKTPENALLDRVAVSINGKLLPIANELKQGVVVDSVNRVVRIPVSDELKKESFLLELSYNAPARFGPRGRYEAQFPKFLGKSVWVRRTYWQVVMRYDRHIVVDPENWTAEFVVKRGGWIGVYRRFPTMSQEELAQWLGLAKTEPLPEEANVYLYSAFGDGNEISVSEGEKAANPGGQSGAAPEDGDREKGTNHAQNTSKSTDDAPVAAFYVVERALLILIGSGAALIIGLSLTYFPVLRNKVSLFLIALIVLAASAFRPLLALLFLQTTVLGVALAFAALALSKLTTKDATARANTSAAAIIEQKKRAAEQAIVKE